MPSAAERYNFPTIENYGQAFIDEMQELCIVHNVAAVKSYVLTRTCNKDVLSSYLSRALELIERQHMFLINQRVHISSYKSDIIQLQTDLIDAQKKSIDKFENKVTQFKNEISKTVQETVERV